MGLQFVFNGPDAGLVWADSALDISGEVIKKLDSAKPATAKPAAPTKPPGSVIAGLASGKCSRTPHPPLSLAPRRRRRRARAGEADGRVQERHRQRRLLPGTFPGQAADAGGPDDRGADAGGDGAAARPTPAPYATSRVQLRGVDGAKFRRQVVPGDQLRLTVTLQAPQAGRSCRAQRGRRSRRPDRRRSRAGAGADTERATSIRRRASHDGAVVGAGTIVGAFAIIGPNVRIGRNCKIGASAVIDGHTTIGDGTEMFPYRLDRPARRRT